MFRRDALALPILALGLPIAKASAQTTITHWDFIKPGDGSPRGNAWQQILQRFKTKNPEINVEVQVMPSGTIDPSLIQGAATGMTPDTVRVTNYALVQHAKAGSIQALDAFFKSSDDDWLIPIADQKIGGALYGLPWDYRFQVLQYRKGLLERAGVQVPRTWSELCSAGGTLTSSTVMGFGFGASRGEAAYAPMEMLDLMAATLGASIYNSQGGLGFNNDAGLRYFQTIADLTGKCGASKRQVLGFTSNEIVEGLASGTLAIAETGTQKFSTIRAKGATDLAWGPAPSFDEGTAAPAVLESYNVAMGSAAKNPEAAWQFMEFITSPELQVLVGKAGEVPTRKSTYGDDWFKTPEAALLNQWSEYISKNGRVNKYRTNFQDLSYLVADAVQAVILQKRTPQQALQDVVDSYGRLPDEN